MWTIITVVFVGWAACGVLAYGYTFAYFQRKYPETGATRRGLSQDRRLALLAAACGPFGLWASMADGGAQYGLKFRGDRR